VSPWIFSQPSAHLGVHAGNALRRIEQTVAVNVFADRIENLSHCGRDAVEVDRLIWIGLVHVFSDAIGDPWVSPAACGEVWSGSAWWFLGTVLANSGRVTGEWGRRSSRSRLVAIPGTRIAKNLFELGFVEGFLFD